MTPNPYGFNPKGGEAFDNLDVARCYVCRPPYAPALYEYLLGLVPGRARMLDLGCGPGKIARALAPHFAEVVAIDPSAPMLEVGRALDDCGNIHWLCSKAEDATLTGSFDLIAAGTSIHWMDHPVVFPMLAGTLAAGGVLAIIDGDGAYEPQWNAPWVALMTRWLAKFGRIYDERAFAASGKSYLPWMDVREELAFTFDFEHPIEDFVALQHSRATWTRANMGANLAAEFDEDLRAMLAPHADRGMLHYRVKSNLVWGTPRTSKKDSLND